MLLLGMASLLGSCKEVVEVSPTTKVVEVGETTTMTCTFNKGQEVEWSKSNDNVSFIPSRSSKIDEIDIMGLKEGFCTVTATGKRSVDSCVVTVKTYISKTELELKMKDTDSFIIKSGYDLIPDDYDDCCFIVEQKDSQKTEDGYFEKKFIVKAQNVGEANISLYDTKTRDKIVDAGIHVNVLPSYFEPVDFDDTQDSVEMKICMIEPIIEFNDNGSMTWRYENYYDSYLLDVIFGKDDLDLVSSFIVTFIDKMAINRITEDIKLRYSYDEFYSLLYTTALGYDTDVYVNADRSKLVCLVPVTSGTTEALIVDYLNLSSGKSGEVQNLLGQRIKKHIDAIK